MPGRIFTLLRIFSTGLRAAMDEMSRTPRACCAVALILLPLSAPVGFADALVSQYRNPVGVSIADPFVLKVGTLYYLYGTTDSDNGFEVFTSGDLVHWSRQGYCYRKTADSWGQACFWAPEVLALGGQYYLYYTSYNPASSMRNISVATSTSPLGPFTDARTPLLPSDRGFIDASPFHDPVSGRYYIYAMEENLRPPKIWVATLADSLTETSSSLTECLTASQAWENEWVEGPFVIRHRSWYYMLYSGNGYGSPDYAVGYAWSNSPQGPWRKYGGNPVLARTAEVSGPGHNCVTMSPDDTEPFIVYHRHLTFAGGWQRELAIDRLAFRTNGTRPDILYVVNGPSSTLQNLPSGSTARQPGASDAFDSAALDDRRWWTFGQDSTSWQLSSGTLILNTQDGDLWQDRVDAKNVFLQYAPSGDFDIETQVSFDPVADFEQAFLIVWENQSNYVKCGTVHSFFPRLEAAVETDGQYSSSLAANTIGADVRLRIERRGSQCRCYAGRAGQTSWVSISSPVDFITTQPQIGLGAYSPGSGAHRAARFEYFNLSVPSVISDWHDY